MSTQPIGVFDSGVGGLTVVAELSKRLPAESILYLGDTARLPYGTKSPETVTRYTRKNIDFLVEREVKAIVVACNTASALALEQLRTDVPTFGVVEPGAARAAAASRGRVGVLATESTVLSGAYPRALARLRPDLEVVAQACPLFVPLVEEGWHRDPIAGQIAERYLRPVLERGVDTLLLGCTHYPMLLEILQGIAGPEVELVDSAAAIADSVVAALADGSIAPNDGGEEPHLCVTDNGARFARIAQRILGADGPSLELVDVI